MRPLFPGAPAPSLAQGDTRRNNTTGSGQLSSSGVRTPSNHPQLPVHTGLDVPGGRGVLICTVWGARGQESPRCPVSQGERRIPAVSPGARGLRCWDRAPGPRLPKATGRSPLRPEPPPDPRLLPEAPPGMLWPFTELVRGVWGALPGRTSPVSDPGSLEAPLPLLRSCPISLLSTFCPGRIQCGFKIFEVPASQGLGFPVLEALLARP